MAARSNLKSTNKNKPKTIAFDSSSAYGEALERYWRGEFVAAERFIADCLSTNPDHPQRFPMYRMWIEILADRMDNTGLRELTQHFGSRTQGGDSDIYTALRGIAHYELDEQNAAQFFFRILPKNNFQDENSRSSLKSQAVNPYAIELQQKLEIRHGEPKFPTLSKISSSINDYVQFQSLVAGWVQLENFAEAITCSHVSAKRFPNSPLSNQVALHLNWEVGNYGNAAKFAEKLTSDRPQNSQFQFEKGMIQYHLENFWQAAQALNECSTLNPGQEPEAETLLKSCLENLSTKNEVNMSRSRASHGLAEHSIETQQSMAVQNFTNDMETEATKKGWIRILTPGQQYIHGTSRRADIASLDMPMGNRAMPGDWCFLVGRTSENESVKEEWKILAIYEVQSRPLWHPFDKNTSRLKLILKPTYPISVAVRLEDSKSDTDSNGILELTNQAFEVLLAEAMRQKDSTTQHHDSEIQHKESRKSV